MAETSECRYVGRPHDTEILAYLDGKYGPPSIEAVQIIQDNLAHDLSEEAEAWIWTPRDGAYPRGVMRDGLGWVSEANICRGAAANPDHIYFLRWIKATR